MEEVKVNLMSILKYAPKGTKLYSPICGECEYKGYSSESIYTDQLVFNYWGEYYDGCEVLLYPSKTHRNWDNWQNVLFTPGTFITGNGETLLVVNWKGCYNSKGEAVTIQYPNEWGFATNDEIEKFHNELRSHEYTYTVKDGLRKVKPKFKENDFVVGPDAHVYQIVAVASINYAIIDVRSNTRKIETKKIDDIDKYYHPWTILDAKAGDILVTGKDRRPYVFKGTFVNDKPQGLCGIGVMDTLVVAPTDIACWSNKFSYPATLDEKKSFLDRVEREGWILDLGKLTITNDDSLGSINPQEAKQILNECHTDADGDGTVDAEHILAPYHPNHLMPFDKVLVRDYDGGVWTPDFFSEYHENGDQKFHTMIMNQGWVQCIPVNHETIKLYGTTDKCSPKYIFW